MTTTAGICWLAGIALVSLVATLCTASLPKHRPEQYHHTLHGANLIGSLCREYGEVVHPCHWSTMQVLKLLLSAKEARDDKIACGVVKMEAAAPNYCAHLSKRPVLAGRSLWWYVQKALHPKAGCPSPQVRPAEQHLHVRSTYDLVPLADSAHTYSHAPADSGRAGAKGCIAAAPAGCGGEAVGALYLRQCVGRPCI